MKKLFLIIVSIVSMAYSQTDTLKSNWDYKAITGVSVNQVALDNWTQGGENTFAWTIGGNFVVSYHSEKWSFKNDLKVSFGMTRIGSDNFRTNDNDVFNETVLSYLIGIKLNPYFSNTIRTVFSKGFDYKQPGIPQISAFFDPGYIIQGLGFEYTPIKNVSTRFGLAFQEIFTNKFNSYSDDPLTPEIEKFKFETGLESVSEGSTVLMENISLITRLTLFTRFKSLDVWDVRWDNAINAKVNDFISVNLNVLLVYQLNQSVKTQLKEALQVGFTYRLF